MSNKAAIKACEAWELRRNAAITAAKKAAEWSLEPYPGVRASKHSSAGPLRVCMSLNDENYKHFQTACDDLAAEIPGIVALFDSPPSIIPRRLWLPVFAEQTWFKLVYQAHTAYRGVSNQSSVITHEDEIACGVTRTVELDLAVFFARKRWKRENVTIRVHSGTRYAALAWIRDGRSYITRIVESRCIVLPSISTCASIAGRVKTPQGGRAPRTDKKVATDTWHEYEFVYYAEGRPSRPKKAK